MAEHLTIKTPLAHWRAKAASLMVAVVSLVLTATEASAACGYKSLENLSPLTRSDSIPITVVFGPSEVSAASEAALRFERAIEATRSKILEFSGEFETLTIYDEVEVEQIYRQRARMVAVIDPQFMKEGKPKYNSLLRSFKDTAIAADQILILDPWPLGDIPEGRPDRAFIQVTNSVTPEMLPYLLELAAYLWYYPNLFSTAEFAQYAALVTDEAADGGFLHSATLAMREGVVVNCLETRFRP